MAQGDGFERLPPVAGDIGHPGRDAPDRRLVQADADHGLGACPQTGVDVLLGFGDGHVRTFLGAYRDGDVDTLVVLLDGDVVHPGVVVDLGPWSMPSTVRTVSASSTMEPGRPVRSDSTWTSPLGGSSAPTTSSTTPERHRWPGLSTYVPGIGERAGEGLGGPLGQSAGDGARLGVAMQDGIDHVVDRAGADRIVGGVAHHLLPGQAEQRVRPLRGRLEERGQRLGPPLEFALGQPAHALDVDPVGGDAHQHVGAEARTKLALPALQPLGRRGGEVLWGAR